MPASGFYGCTHPKKHLQLYHWLKSLFPQYLLEQMRRSGGLPSPRANVPCEWGPCKMEIQEAGSSQGGRIPCWYPAQAKKKKARQAQSMGLRMQGNISHCHPCNIQQTTLSFSQAVLADSNSCSSKSLPAKIALDIISAVIHPFTPNLIFLRGCFTFDD